MSVEIPLTNGGVAIVDDEDYDLVKDKTWWRFDTRRTCYAVSYHTYMHRLIASPTPPLEVDHKDRDGLNNRRENLRVCLHKDNMKNLPRSSNATNQYRGVTRNGAGWKAQIRINGTRKYLGTFKSAYDAAIAYDSASLELHGEFGSRNFS